ncbi:MAG: alpha/beta hydrolase family protein [Massilia sp.]
MSKNHIEFPANGHTLSARLELPDGPARATAIFAHCFTCGKDAVSAARIAHALPAHGIAVLRFDFTGLGASEGDFSETNFSSNVADLLAAADYLRQRGMAPAMLIGHSLGGAAVLAAAGSIPEVKAVVTIGAPAEPSHVTHLFGEQIEEIERYGEAEVDLAGRPFNIKRQFIEDVTSHKLSDKIATLGRALLVMHSPIDDTVDISNATRILAAARHPKSFVSLDDADHLVTRRDDALYVADVIAAWSGRYI